MDRCMDGGMDGCMDGWIDGWKNQQCGTDGESGCLSHLVHSGSYKKIPQIECL